MLYELSELERPFDAQSFPALAIKARPPSGVERGEKRRTEPGVKKRYFQFLLISGVLDEVLRRS